MHTYFRAPGPLCEWSLTFAAYQAARDRRGSQCVGGVGGGGAGGASSSMLLLLSFVVMAAHTCMGGVDCWCQRVLFSRWHSSCLLTYFPSLQHLATVKVLSAGGLGRGGPCPLRTVEATVEPGSKSRLPHARFCFCKVRRGGRMRWSRCAWQQTCFLRRSEKEAAAGRLQIQWSLFCCCCRFGTKLK